MRDLLAERLLGKVMKWSGEDIARERPVLQAFAAYKYDEYQQYSPGMRFVESLALWLAQFRSDADRCQAYDFVKQRLVFFSTAEMNHLVAMAYPHHVRISLRNRVADEVGLSPYRITAISKRPEFRRMERQTLFLGLSDGARIDVFRRSNRRSIDHEQVLQTHEVEEDRVTSLLNDLETAEGNGSRFRTLVLLDDFSASGRSYLRQENGEWKGKLARFLDHLQSSTHPMARLVSLSDLKVVIVLYIGTEFVAKRLEELLQQRTTGMHVRFQISIVHLLRETIRISRDSSDPMVDLVMNDAYYDASIHDRHMKVGGSPDSKFGFADGGLPLILSHNSPNNSIALLWSYVGMSFRGLFPRVQRHK
jgi:hypothetical protein